MSSGTSACGRAAAGVRGCKYFGCADGKSRPGEDGKSFGSVDGKSGLEDGKSPNSVLGLRMASPLAEDGKSFGSEDGKSWLEDGKSPHREAYFGCMTFLKWSMYLSTYGR